MASTTHLADVPVDTCARQRKNPLAFWHLLSLDAPTVAMLWTWFIARVCHIRLPATSVLAMGIAVWLLYAADRLLDTRLTGSRSIGLEPRHHFHRLHHRSFSLGIVFASGILAMLLPQLALQSIHLYLILGTLLFGYFILIHVNMRAFTHANPYRLPKEIFVGIFFSAAVFIPTVAREPSFRATLFPAAILFATLCSLNCLFIYKWEHIGASDQNQTHPATGLALRFLIPVAIALITTAITLAVADRRLPWPVPSAIAFAAALLLLLHRTRHHLSPTTLRAAADLCLLTPLLFLPLLPN